MKSSPLKAFIGSFQNFAHTMYITDIVKMCIWELYAEKILFDLMAGFLTKPFYDNCTLFHFAILEKAFWFKESFCLSVRYVLILLRYLRSIAY